MAQAAALIPGNRYPVRSGQYAGQTVTVEDNTPVPDGSPNQRKVLVSTASGEMVYILPRLLDDGVPTLSEVRAAAVQGQAPVTTLVTNAIGANDDAPLLAPAPQSVTVHQAGTHAAEQVPVVEYDPITDPMDPRLDPWRPDPEVVDQYVSRNLPGGKTDTEVLLNYWRRKQNVLLVGDTQSGKTMMVNVLSVLAAKEAGLPKPYPVFTLSGSAGISDFDLFGQVTSYTPPGGAERLVWLPGIVDMACRVPSFLYLDETNMMSERVTASLHSVCDSRRFFVNRNKAVPVENDGFMPEVVNVNPDTWIIGTYNDGYAGAGALQEAFTNRFVHLPWDYDDEVEKHLITSPTVRALGEALRTARAQSQLRTPVGTKALQVLQETAYEEGAEFAVWAFCGMFPSRDRAKVQTIIQDRSFATMLTDEVLANQP